MRRFLAWVCVVAYVSSAFAVVVKTDQIGCHIDGYPADLVGTIGTGVVWPLLVVGRVAVWSVDPTAAARPVGCQHKEAAP